MFVLSLSHTCRKSLQLCVLWRVLSFRRWWHTTSTSSKRSAYTTCQVKRHAHAMFILHTCTKYQHFLNVYFACLYCNPQVLMVCLWTSPFWWTSGTRITKSCSCVWSQTFRVRTHSTQTSMVSRFAFIYLNCIQLLFYSPNIYPLIDLDFCKSIIHCSLLTTSFTLPINSVQTG